MAESAEPATETVGVEEKKQQDEEIVLPDKEESTSVEAVNNDREPVHEQKQEQQEQKEEEQEREREQEQELEGQEEENHIQTLEDSQTAMKLPEMDLKTKPIEEEEMPSLITASSLSKIDELENDEKYNEDKRFEDVDGSSIRSNPREDENNDSDSVCVIDDDDDDDDDDDAEDDDRDRDGDEDGSSFEEDESSSYRDDDDSDEMDRERYNDNHERRNLKSIRRTENEEEEEEEEDEEEEEVEVEEDEEAEYDSVDGFDGGSDDLVLRHSNGVTKRKKERSASLQDLSNLKEGTTKNKTVSPKRFERTQFNKERRTSGKQYSHIESKVKKYILDMTQQRRISGERRKKAQEEARHKNQDPNEMQMRRTDNVALTCKTIKNYTEKALKEVAEYEESEQMYVMPPTIENGEICVYTTHPSDNNHPVIEEEMEVDMVEIDSPRKDERADKVNGNIINENQNYISEKRGIHRRDQYSLKPVLNGEGPSNCNRRTLTYEEYMKGPIKELNKEIMNQELIEEMHNISEKCNNNDSEPACVLRIENVTSNYCNSNKMPNMYHDTRTPIQLVNQSTETYYQENYEISSLKLQLDQKNSQFDKLRDAYQKSMSENIAMKMELENLRKMLVYYQEQQKAVPETKAIAVQTEDVAALLSSKTTVNKYNSNEVKADPKLTTNSIVSTVSSQWSDSTESGAISMEPPPNVTGILNLDESTQPQPQTPLKQKNAFSRAFLTSSKILQTLSSITHGKPKIDRYGCKYSKSNSDSVTEPNVSSENEKARFVEIASSNSKKRKATDIAEISSSAQPFKIPHTSKTNWETGKRILNTPEVESLNDDNSLGYSEMNVEENEGDKIKEMEDDVKVFVYPEDEHGKEHSFLIQAREIPSNSNAGVRECGPYLLGNVEVYMTEMNGTINIWGKELSQNSTNQNIEELENSTRSKEIKPNFRWQSTPRIFNEHATASTSKKSRVVPRFTQQQKRHSCEINNSMMDCENCHSHNHRLSWPSCNKNVHENQHTCCSPSVRIDAMQCECGHKIERRNINVSTCCNSKFMDARRYSLPNVYEENNSPCCCTNHHNQCRNVMQEESCRYQPFVRRHSFPTDEENDSDVEENAHITSKSCHSIQENSLHSCSDNKLVQPTNNKKSNGSCTEPSNCQNENDTLIFQKQNPEAPEVRKGKSNGKRVRGLLMDLLKGCGDCRTSNPINNKSNTHNTSVYEPSSSAQHKISCSPNQQSCSPRSNDKCSSCRCRNNKTAEIEAQLEFFRVEMEKLRNRSDTLRVMLDTLRNNDTTNE